MEPEQRATGEQLLDIAHEDAAGHERDDGSLREELQGAEAVDVLATTEAETPAPTEDYPFTPALSAAPSASVDPPATDATPERPPAAMASEGRRLPSQMFLRKKLHLNQHW